jgi:hypothetical protein
MRGKNLASRIESQYLKKVASTKVTKITIPIINFLKKEWIGRQRVPIFQKTPIKGILLLITLKVRTELIDAGVRENLELLILTEM